MIDGLRPYPEMKPSHLSWLGDVPAHWGILRAKRLLKATEIPVRPDDEIVTCFRDGQVTLRKNRRSSGFMIALLEQGYQGVRVGQLVVHSMDAFAGAIGVSDSDGKCTPEYIVCEPRADSAVPGYYSWVLRQAARTGYIVASCPAVRERAPRLRYPDLGELRVPVPSPDEQRLIVRFLDWHGGQTAKLIRAKKKIIELLNEQKQAIIHRAVTRGLDPNAKLNPSGIPWLGDVPEGWEVKRLKNVCRINPSKTAIKNRPSDELATFLPMERVSSDGKIDGGIQVPISGLADGFTYFERNDVILAKITPCFENGKGAVLDALPTEVGFGSTEFIVLRALGAIDPRFLYLLTFEAQFRRLGVESMTGSAGQQRISQEFVANYFIALPGGDEQVRIVETLKAATHEFDAVIDAAFREIALIQEFRTRLIADVVTGKLDVRAIAATLPEVADDQPITEAGDDEEFDEPEADAKNEEVAA